MNSTPARTSAVIVLVCIVVSSFASNAADDAYVIAKGEKKFCAAFLGNKHVEQIKATVKKSSPIWAEHKKKCPELLARRQGTRPGRGEADDYALYEIDIDNDGISDSVLYLRYDYEHYTTFPNQSGDARRVDGMETEEEFHTVDLGTCERDKVFAMYASSTLIRRNGKTYIRNINLLDRAKTVSIYQKSKDVALIGSYVDDVCRFQLKFPVKGKAK